MTRPVFSRSLLARQSPEVRAILAKSTNARAAHGRQGHAAKRSGDTWEAWMAAQHTEAAKRGYVARVEHVGAPSKHVDRDRVVLTGVAPPDYLGTLSDGRSLVVEAKHRAGRLYRSGHRTAVEPHQRAYLDDVSATRALVLLVVAFERAAGTLRYAVPWGLIAWRDESVGPTELRGWEVSEGCYLARWMDDAPRAQEVTT